MHSSSNPDTRIPNFRVEGTSQAIRKLTRENPTSQDQLVGKRIRLWSHISQAVTGEIPNIMDAFPNDKFLTCNLTCKIIGFHVFLRSLAVSSNL